MIEMDFGIQYKKGENEDKHSTYRTFTWMRGSLPIDISQHMLFMEVFLFLFPCLEFQKSSSPIDAAAIIWLYQKTHSIVHANEALSINIVDPKSWISRSTMEETDDCCRLHLRGQTRCVCCFIHSTIVAYRAHTNIDDHDIIHNDWNICMKSLFGIHCRSIIGISVVIFVDWYSHTYLRTTYWLRHSWTTKNLYSFLRHYDFLFYLEFENDNLLGYRLG